MKSVLDTIKKRHSVRHYAEKEIKKEILQTIKRSLDENKTGPFGSEVRFDIVDATDYEQAELKNLGTYGMIKGARVYVAGVVKKGERAMEDFGYCMEKNVLMLTDLGIATCWIGGSLNRSVFASKMNAAEDELLPGITPIGYPSGKKTFAESMMAATSAVAGNKTRRKKPEELFFDKSLDTPLSLNTCGKYATVLDAVRVAPSAMNGQPWRIIRGSGNTYHMFMREKDTRFNHYGDVRFQRMDMGIAMCHFELAARELGLKGSWQTQKPSLDSKAFVYVVSWTEKG
jgi:nitroreductase